MAKLRKQFTSDDFRRAMERVCPSDAEADEEMQRLLDRMGGPLDKPKREP